MIPNQTTITIIQPLPGGSMKSKCTRSSIPSFFSCSTTEPRLERRISGYVLSCISCLYAFSVYRRKHFPGFVRPARPALCWALALLMAVTSRDSTRILGLYTYITWKKDCFILFFSDFYCRNTY